MFGPSYGDLRGTAEQCHANWLALCMALAEKGVIDADDVMRHRVAALQMVEQTLEQAIREKNKRELDENPGLAIMAKLFGEEIPLPAEEK